MTCVYVVNRFISQNMAVLISFFFWEGIKARNYVILPWLNDT